MKEQLQKERPKTAERAITDEAGSQRRVEGEERRFGLGKKELCKNRMETILSFLM